MRNGATAADVERLKDLLAELGRLRSIRDPLSAVGIPELTSLQCHAVAWLGRDGALSMGTLAQRIGSPVPAATGVIDRLEKLGYVVRDRAVDDRRVVQVALTETGQALSADLDRAIGEGLAQLLSVLPDDDRRALLGILERLLAYLAAAPREGTTPRAPDDARSDLTAHDDDAARDEDPS